MKYPIRDFSKISGISHFNLRYYEQMGVLAPKRTAKGYREYDAEDSFRINTFNMMLAEGFTIREAVERLDPVDNKTFSQELLTKNLETAAQIELLQARLVWNEKLAYAYAHMEQEFSVVRRISLPACWFFPAVDDHNWQRSLQNSAVIENWVRHLPVVQYACHITPNRRNLGFCVPADYAQRHGLMRSADVRELPARDCLCILDRGEEMPLRLGSLPALLKRVAQEKGICLVPEVLCIYLMTDVKGCSDAINYLLVPIADEKVRKSAQKCEKEP